MKVGDLQRDFTNENFSINVDKLNTGLAVLNFSDNFNGKPLIINSLKKGQELEYLIKDFSPKGYLILKQSGNGIISSTKEWPPNGVRFINHGPEEVTGISIFILG